MATDPFTTMEQHLLNAPDSVFADITTFRNWAVPLGNGESWEITSGAATFTEGPKGWELRVKMGKDERSMWVWGLGEGQQEMPKGEALRRKIIEGIREWAAKGNRAYIVNV